MDVVEIFESVSGEVGKNIPQGSLAMFIRFAGCSLHCSWCDAKNSWNSGQREFSLEHLEKIMSLSSVPNLIVTGGEPFEQKDIIPFLHLARKYFRNIAVETSGYLIPEVMFTEFYEISLLVDYKPKSANALVPTNELDLFYNLRFNDVVKFPFASLADLNEAVVIYHKIKKQFARTGITPPRFAFSPIPPEDFTWIADYLMENNVDAIVNIQIHKVLGVQ